MAVRWDQVDRDRLTDAEVEYLARNDRYESAHRHNRGFPGVGPIGRVDHNDDDREAPRVTPENAQLLRDAAASDYAQRIANSWRNRG